MNYVDIAAIISALTSLVTAIGGVLVLIRQSRIHTTTVDTNKQVADVRQVAVGVQRGVADVKDAVVNAQETLTQVANGHGLGNGLSE